MRLYVWHCSWRLSSLGPLDYSELGSEHLRLCSSRSKLWKKGLGESCLLGDDLRELWLRKQVFEVDQAIDHGGQGEPQPAGELWRQCRTFLWVPHLWVTHQYFWSVQCWAECTSVQKKPSGKVLALGWKEGFPRNANRQGVWLGYQQHFVCVCVCVGIHIFQWWWWFSH